MAYRDHTTPTRKEFNLFCDTVENGLLSEAVLFLQRFPASAVQMGDSGMTPLSHAARGGRMNMTKLLMDHGAKVNTQDSDGATPLVHAAKWNHVDLTRLLLEKGADVNAFKGAALMFAAYDGPEELIKLLLDHGADMNVTTETGMSVLQFARLRNRGEMVSRLLDAEIKKRDAQNNVRITAQIESLKKEAPAAKEVQTMKQTPMTEAELNAFIHAVSQGDTVSVLRFLHQYGDDADSFNRGNTRALAAAVAGNHMDIAHMLLDAGTDIERRDAVGRTVLCIAAERGLKNMTEFLLNRGAQVDARLYLTQQTTLMGIAGYGDPDVLRLLLDRGADVNAKDTTGITPLMVAARRGRVDTMELLLQRGADIDAVDDDGRSVMLFAAGSESAPALAFINAKMEEHRLALGALQAEKRLEAMRRLRGNKPDFKKQNFKRPGP